MFYELSNDTKILVFGGKLNETMELLFDIVLMKE